MELASLTGIGKNRLEALHAAGIFSLRDLLYAVPQKYRDCSAVTPAAQAAAGQRQCFSLVREGEAKLARFKGKMTLVTCSFSDESGRLTACWFNQPWMKDNLNRGTRFLLCGPVESRGGRLQLMNPSLEKENRIVPLYRPIEGLPQRVHEQIAREALESLDEVCPETLPLSLVKRYELLPLGETLRRLHAPQTMDEIPPARRRLAFEQMLIYQAGIRMMRRLRRGGLPMEAPARRQDAFWDSLPFSPTNAQRRTLSEIARDMELKGPAPYAMARMVQGDVGSGKTAVAMGAMLLAAQSGYQSALMAPTEILARQHWETMRPFFEKNGFGCGLLVSGMPARERREALAAIREGRWQAVIGTHALIGSGVHFQHLGLCITDEQHRFGVAQRTALLEKGGDAVADLAPHLLVMSATPIPRSLALSLFGDLDVSVIDELPPGRQPVKTRLVPESKRGGLYDFIRQELKAGRQAYIVCPLVEESETADGLMAVKSHARELSRKAFADFSVGLTYGTQPAAEKQAALADFAAGKLQILVSTTVIEVGVNVPNASVMVIEDADRYGLAQLHQLRGRVGRGTTQSWCFLMAEPNERLQALVRTNDGFQIAQTDLELRGPGELLGTRQHGEALTPGAGDMTLLYRASQCVEEISSDPAFSEEWKAVQALAEAYVRESARRVSVS